MPSPVTIKLHPATWHLVPHGVADVLRQAVSELQGQLAGTTTELTVELAGLPDGSLRARIHRDQDVHECVVPTSETTRTLDEYTATLDRLSHLQPDAPARGFQAIDYARRVLHDELADLFIHALAPALPLDLEAARRLVTVVVLMLRPTSPGLAVLSRTH